MHNTRTDARIKLSAGLVIGENKRMEIYETISHNHLPTIGSELWTMGKEAGETIPQTRNRRFLRPSIGPL